jgi:hypothetical protein
LQINYCCPFWGCEKELPHVFVHKVLEAQYDGIEIFLPAFTDPFTKTFIKELETVQNKNNHFTFIAQEA